MHRDNLSSFTNFVDMYDNIHNEMMFTGVAGRINQPIWLDSEGRPCKEEVSFGSMMAHRLIYQDNCFMAYEVGANTS